MILPLRVKCLHISEESGWNASLSDQVFGHVADSGPCSQNVVCLQTVHLLILC